jgi:hypothetical protein
MPLTAVKLTSDSAGSPLVYGGTPTFYCLPRVKPSAIPSGPRTAKIIGIRASPGGCDGSGHAAGPRDVERAGAPLGFLTPVLASEVRMVGHQLLPALSQAPAPASG